MPPCDARAWIVGKITGLEHGQYPGHHALQRAAGGAALVLRGGDLQLRELCHGAVENALGHFIEP